MSTVPGLAGCTWGLWAHLWGKDPERSFALGDLGLPINERHPVRIGMPRLGPKPSLPTLLLAACRSSSQPEQREHLTYCPWCFKTLLPCQTDRVNHSPIWLTIRRAVTLALQQLPFRGATAWARVPPWLSLLSLPAAPGSCRAGACRAVQLR